MYQTVVALVLAAMLIGCGGGSTPELADVEGAVTLDGNPLPDATVRFQPVSGGRPSIAVTDAKGRYKLLYSHEHAGATPGKHRVTITTAATTADEDGNEVVVPEKLPTKYNTESELAKDVEAGKNKIDFALDSQGEIAEQADVTASR